MIYSLRKYCRSYSNGRARSLILLLKTPKYAGKVLVLVEGWEDVLVYEKFFIQNTVTIKDCGGCNDVIATNVYLKKYSPNTTSVAILDSDFRYLNKLKNKKSNIVYTDTHDMETFILFDSHCFKKVVNKLKCSNVSHYDIVKDLRLLSYMRWYNMSAKMKYKECNLDVVNISATKIKNYDYLINYFRPSTGSHKTWLKRCFFKFRNKHLRAKSEYIINGHDYLNRFCYYAKKRDNIQISAEDVLLEMAVACDMDWFKSTNMYVHLFKWQIKNSINLLTA